MKILEIELVNFKKHQFKNISIDGKSIFILGPNEAGKSSILDAIFAALSPAKETAETKIPKPLHKDAKAGHVKIVIGKDGEQYTVVRKYTEGSDDRKISITGPNHLSSTKIDMLDKLFGYTKIDPFEFVEWSNSVPGRRKQLDLIESLLSPEVRAQLSEMNVQIQMSQERATVLNNERLALDKSLAGLGVTENDLKLYAEPIDSTEELKKLQDAEKHNKEVQERIAKAEKQKKDLEVAKKSAISKKQEIERLQEELRELNADIAMQETDLEAMQAVILMDEEEDTAPYETRIRESNQHNQRNTLVQKHAETNTSLNEKITALEEEKAKGDKLKADRAAAISSAKLPIAGLSFDEQQIYLDGIPLHDKQVSTSQIIKLTFAIALAMGGTEDKLKLICIPRGESLDNNSIDALKDFLAENPDWQCFCEEVDRNAEELKIEYIEKA